MFALLFAAIPTGAVIGGVFSGWVSRIERHGLAVVVCIVLWGASMAGFGFAVALADRWPTPMLIVALALLVVGGAADMASAGVGAATAAAGGGILVVLGVVVTAVLVPSFVRYRVTRQI